MSRLQRALPWIIALVIIGGSALGYVWWSQGVTKSVLQGIYATGTSLSMTGTYVMGTANAILPR